jgi:hypothetical protein
MPKTRLVRRRRIGHCDLFGICDLLFGIFGRPKIPAYFSLLPAVCCRLPASYSFLYTPTLTFLNLAGAAPWPVWAICEGWPLPQLGVPHMIQ